MCVHTNSCDNTWLRKVIKMEAAWCCVSKRIQQAKRSREGDAKRRDHTTFFQKWHQGALPVLLFWKHLSKILKARFQLSARILLSLHVFPHSPHNHKVVPNPGVQNIHRGSGGLLDLRNERKKVNLCKIILVFRPFLLINSEIWMNTLNIKL